MTRPVLPLRIKMASPTYSNRTYAYRYVAFRCPKKGEVYLSGAIIEGYVAPNDLTTKYHVIELVLN